MVASEVSLKIKKVLTNKQCSQRYKRNINPKVEKKPVFEKYDDDTLVDLYIQFGPKWSMFTTILQGKSDVQLYNRFLSLIKLDSYYQKINKNSNILDQSEGNLIFHLNNHQISENIKVDENNYNREKQFEKLNDFMKNLKISSPILLSEDLKDDFFDFSKIKNSPFDNSFNNSFLISPDSSFKTFKNSL
jgi:hypothetical protein